MVEAGIECRTIFPLRFPWILSNWNYRDHCKIVTIDRKESFTGGMNVGYEYTGLKPDVGFWRDTHLQIIGEATGDLQRMTGVGIPGFPSNVWIYALCNVLVFPDMSISLSSRVLNSDPNSADHLE